MLNRCIIIMLSLGALISATQILAQDIERSGGTESATCPVANAPPSHEAAFGPEAGAEALILKVIGCAKTAIRMSAFALSSPVIVDALIAAQRHGVNVQVVADYRHNVVDDAKGRGRKALTRLSSAGIAVRTNAIYRIHHEKIIIVDARTVQTGSYNYAASANQNSENVLVIWNDPALAAQYLAHWESRFKAGVAYLPGIDPK
ncbi:MAG: phospholipase D family protein [Candidatus Competibacteraceae bacterium]